jgi:A/G-specific adenine glycosylase
MSQQTQLSRVIPKYEAWLERFPTVESLAQAPVSDVLRHWSGLGYNRRALNLQKTAQIVAKDYQGKFPKEVAKLVKLPGLGKYTASAAACFAFDAQIPVIDTNIRKVISHEFFQGELPDEKTIEDTALEILPKGKAYEWNQALMDYSALMLKDKKIPVPKQSHFLSSNRYYRGQTIKLLLEVKEISLGGLWDFFEDHNPIERSRLEEILESMQKEGLVEMKKNSITLPSL